MNTSARSSLWDRPWFILLIRAAAALMVLALGTGIYFNAVPNIPERSDFSVLYASALSYLDGKGLYQQFMYAPIFDRIVFLGTPAHPDGMRLMENLNPPVVTFLLVPFALLDLRSSYYLWCGVQYALGIVLLWRLLDGLELRHRLLRPAMLLGYTAYFPAFANLLLGQIGMFLFAPLALAALALRRGREREAGCWLGLALLVKLFTGLVFVWFLLQRRWTVLWWGALVWALGMFAALLVFGVQDHLNWLQVMQRHEAASLSWNASLNGISERYFGTSLVITSLWTSPWASWLLHSTGFLFAGLSVLWLNRQEPALGQQRAGLLGLALCLPLMLLLAPLGWIYYFPVLLVSAPLIWWAARETPQRRRVGIGLAAALMLSAVPQLLTSGNNMRWELQHTYYQDYLIDTRSSEFKVYGDMPYHWFVAPEVYPLALLLVASMALYAAYRSRSTQTGA